MDPRDPGAPTASAPPPGRGTPPTAEQALLERFTQLLDPRRLRTGEQTFLLVLAGLVGIYCGLAAGLFATAISIFRILFLRTAEVVEFARGNDVLWDRFTRHLDGTRWYPSLAIAGLVAAVVAAAYGLVLRRRRDLSPALGALGTRLTTIAIVGGIGLVLYYSLLFLSAFDHTFLRYEGAGHDSSEQWSWPFAPFAPVVGGLLVGLLIHRFSPESRGHGVTEVLESIALHQSRIPAKTAVFKGLTASLTIASGGSVGREGPIVQIGSGIASSVGQFLGVSRSQLRTLVGCGAAGGIAASFDAPIAGAMFALEILLADFTVVTFSPIVLSAVLATVVTRALYYAAQIASGARAFSSTAAVPGELVSSSYQLVSPAEVIPYLLLGVVCGVVSLAFIASLDRAEDLFAGKWAGPVGRALASVPLPLKPAIGGLLVGMLGLALPQVMSTGYGAMNSALMERYGAALALAILFGKIAATSLTLGSGGSGGSFFPSVFIGAMTGSVFGSAVHALFPTWTATSGAYALVGMGALVAGATQGPLTGIVMMFELTGDYHIILPLMLACLSSSSLVNRWLGYSMYTLRLAHKGIDVRARRELEVLRHIPVREVMTRNAQLIPRTMRFRSLLEQLASTPHTTYVVVDEGQRYVGIVTMHDLRAFLFEAGLSDLVVAGDLARTDVAPLAEDEDLQAAFDRLATAEYDHLPVVSRQDATRVVGLLSRKDLLSVYQPGRAPVGELTPGPTPPPRR